MAFLHDIVEDTFIFSFERLEINFGKDVTLGIKLLSKEDKKGYDYIERLKKQGSNNVLIVKLSDRLHNLRSLGNCTKEKQIRQIKETKEKYVPLVDFLIKRQPEKEKYIGKYLKKKIEKIISLYEKE